MLRKLACVAVSMMLLVAQRAASAQNPVADKPSFICVGDGLTESAFASVNNGWGLLMQQRYTRKADIVNRGFGGFFTPWFVDYMLDTLFSAANPTGAIFFLGVKDSLTKDVSGSHYVSPQQFGINVEKMVQAAKRAGINSFVFVTPPPVCEVCKGKSPKPWDRENAHTALYVQQLQQLAQRYGGGFANIFEDWQKDADWDKKYLLPDKLHLNAAGNQKVYDAVNGAISKQVPGMDWNNLPVHYPLMTAIDKENPGTAFSQVVKKPSSKSLAESALVSSSSSNVGSSNADVLSQQLKQQQGAPTATSAAGTLAAAEASAWLAAGLLVVLWQLCFQL